MTTSTHATCEIKTWDEKPYHEAEGQKFSRASVTKSFRGGIEAESILEYLFFHRVDGSAVCVGIEHVVGLIAGRAGSFVLRHEGTYSNGVTKMTCSIVEASATGDLVGISGRGSFEATEKHHAFTLEYAFG